MKMNSENRMMAAIRRGAVFIAFSVIALCACGGLNATSDGAPSGKVDAAVGAADGPAKTVCDPLAPFGPWVSLGDFQNGLFSLPGYPSSDELAFYFSAGLMNDYSLYNLYVSRRARKQDAFGAPTLLVAQNTAKFDGNPTVAADGLSLWFDSSRSGPFQIYVATKASLQAEFGVPALVAGVNTNSVTVHPSVTADGSELWFSSERPGGLGLNDIFKAASTPTGFLAPETVAGLSSSKNDYYPRLSDDRLTIYLTSDRSNAQGNFDILRSHRSTTADGFPTPTAVTELNTVGNDFVSWISPDNCRVYGQSQGILAIATRQP
jgi:hypothetical protein